MDFYEILGLSDSEKQLSGKEFEDVLKEKHRDLVRKWHPDKWVNGTEEEKKTAENKTKEINEAYTTLLDPQKRQQYDFQQQFGAGGPQFDDDMDMDPFEILRRAHGFGGPQYRQPVKHYGEDVTTSINITLQEAYSGCRKTISYYRPAKCHSCNGTGAKDGKMEKCPHCNGAGQFVKSSINGNQYFQQISTCPYCGGTGKAPAEKCPDCNGTGFKQELNTIDVDIPRGVLNNTAIFTDGDGGESPDGGPRGKLIVQINVENNTPFQIDENRNLVYTVKKHYADVLLGFKDTLLFLDGSNVKYAIPELSMDGYEARVAGKGMPILNQYGQVVGSGDLIIRVECTYPKKLTKKDKETISLLKHD